MAPVPPKMVLKLVREGQRKWVELSKIDNSWYVCVDYKKFIDEYLDTTVPAYLFVRFDEKSSTGEYKWLFLCYVPDNAKVRDKMIYASTRATLTRELGDYRFTDNIYGTDKVGISWDKMGDVNWRRVKVNIHMG